MKRFTVSGRAVGFPVDMLRHDRAWPASREDSDTIAGSYGDRSGRARRWQITLETDNDAAPSIARWQSYGLSVVRQESSGDESGDRSHD